MPQRVPLILPFCFCVLLFSRPCHSDDYADWSYSRNILLNTTASGANVASDVAGIPILIRLNPANCNFFSQTLPGGADMRFSKTDGTHLPYQIERWIDAAGDNDTAEIWVKVDTVYGNTLATTLIMYWGNAGAVDSSDGEAVFDSANDCKAVYHLDDNPADGAGSILDQTANSLDGSPSGMDESDRVTGTIGYGLAFDGSTHYIDLGNVSIHKEAAYTVSTWINGPSGQVDKRYFAEASVENDDPLFTLGTDDDGGTAKGEAYIRDDDRTIQLEQNDGPTTDDVFTNTWNHIAWVDTFNGSNNTYTYYVNGRPSGTGTYTKNVKAFTNSSIGGIIRAAVSYHFDGRIDEFRLDQTNRSSDWIKLCYENQRSDQSLVLFSGAFTWDVSTDAGIQPGDGTWGSDPYWTRNGMRLFPWPGTGCIATFAGADGSYTVTVDGTQYVDSIHFANSTYTLSGDTLHFEMPSVITLPSGKITTISTVVAGTSGLRLQAGTGEARINLTGENTYTGVTTIGPHARCDITTLTVGESVCAIGAASNDAANIVLNRGVLRYVGSGTATDRLFTLTADSSCLFSSGSGTVDFTNTGAIAFIGSGNRIIEFGGIYDGANVFAPVIGDGEGGTTSVRKTGHVSTWILTGNNTYTGMTNLTEGGIQVGNNDTTGAITGNIANSSALVFSRSNDYTYGGVISGTGSVTISGSGTTVFSGDHTYTGATDVLDGEFHVNGALNSASVVTVAAGATLGGNGIIGGSVTAEGATIHPGSDGVGKLTTGSLTLDNASVITLELGATNDTLAVTGDLVLDGTINITPVAGFSEGNYRLITWNGAITNNTLEIGDLPAGVDCRLEYEDGFISATFTIGLIQSEPEDITVFAGDDAEFTVEAIGEGTLSYTWQQSPEDDSVGSGGSYSIAPTTVADNGSRFRCIVTDAYFSDTSRWAGLTVIDTPRVASTQSLSDTVRVGQGVSFTITVADSINCTYAWRKTGSSTILSTEDTYTIDAVELENSGGYYCCVTNLVATVCSDTAWLTVVPLLPSIDKQPVAKNLFIGDSLRLSVAASDVEELSYAWKKTGSDLTIDSTTTFSIDSVVESDSGRYYCIITGTGGVVSTDTVHVAVSYHAPVARFSFSPKSGEGPLKVTFTDSSTGVITSRFWRFGDGNVDEDTKNPTHPYADTGLFTVTLIVSGPGGADSLVKKDSVFVFAEGQNPLRISGRFFEERDVVITIENVDLLDTAKPEPWCDSVGIWIKSDSLPKTGDGNGVTLLHVYDRSALTTATIVDTFTLPGDDSLFGIMTGAFWDDGSISEFREANGGFVRIGDTIPADTGQNLVLLKELTYDSLTNEIGISWCIDTTQYWRDTVDVGIVYSLTSYPEEMEGEQIVIVHPGCTDTVVRLSEPLRFDTLYYVAVFSRRPEGEWSMVSEAARDTVRTGPPSMEVVVFFDKESGDTVKAFNEQVLLWNDTGSSDTPKTVDTLEVYTVDPPRGFVVVGTPFRFRKGIRRTATVGVRIDTTSLPDEISISNVRIYHIDDGAVFVNYKTNVDSVNGIVSVKTDSLELPFVAMIDTMEPKVRFLSPIDSVLSPGENFTDSARISDNISNVRWSYWYGRGDEMPSKRDSSELADTQAVCRMRLSKSSISPEYGVRAFLVSNDGVHCDTFNVSRSVFRKESDTLESIPNTWHPFYPTAELYQTNPEKLIVEQVKHRTKEYDQRFLRLFRWVETDKNSDDDDKWVEYDPKNKSVRSLFTLKPGRILWLKTRRSTSFSLGSARTMSLKDTFTVTLNPGEFTDLGMPYRFGVAVEDILAASEGKADNVQFYRWIKDDATGRYKCEVQYAEDIPDKNNLSTEVRYAHSGGYSLYNPGKENVELRIPPTLPSESGGGTAKRKKQTSWGVKFVAKTVKDRYAFAPLYCGYVPDRQKSDYPSPPSFEKVRIFLFDRERDTRQSHYFAEAAKSGVARELCIVNASDSMEQIAYHFETAGTFPDKFTGSCYDKTTNRFTENGTITVAPHSTVSRWIVAADDKWRESFSQLAKNSSYGLHRIYPNPARSVVTIWYTIPLGAQERLRITIFDLRGRKVWEKRVDRLLAAGDHPEIWNGRDQHNSAAGAGMYLVRLTVISATGKTVGRFEQRLTYLP